MRVRKGNAGHVSALGNCKLKNLVPDYGIKSCAVDIEGNAGLVFKENICKFVGIVRLVCSPLILNPSAYVLARMVKEGVSTFLLAILNYGFEIAVYAHFGTCRLTVERVDVAIVYGYCAVCLTTARNLHHTAELIAELFFECGTLCTFVGSCNNLLTLFVRQNNRVTHTRTLELEKPVKRHHIRNLVPLLTKNRMVGYCKNLKA